MSGTPFVEWLRAQAHADKDLPPHEKQPYADLYEHGPFFVRSLGTFGVPDPVAFRAYLLLEDEGFTEARAAELMQQLVIADATWRTDSIEAELPDPPADENGEPLPTPPGGSITARSLRPAICGFRDLDGTRCPSAAVEGSARCGDHGGGITDPGIRGSLLLLAYAQLVHGTAKAVATLIDVMESSTNDLARVNAAKEMLDRAGLGVDSGHVQITAATDGAVDTREAQLERIRAHLDSTRARLMPAPMPDDDEIVDAELVEDDEVA